MATWVSGKAVTDEQLDKAMAALGQACFKCGKEMHTSECPIAKCGNAIRAAKAKPA